MVTDCLLYTSYELDVTKISDDDKYAIKEQIEEFNKYNPLVRTGDYYRIGDPRCV